ASLGAVRPAVTGNIKFDLTIPDSARALAYTLRKRFGENRSIWLAASTRDGEEALILDALLKSSLTSKALLVIVPRHPQRFDDVAALLRDRGVKFSRRSDGQPVPQECSFVLGDSMGELLAYYAAADLAFVGGSLLAFGGQNLIEPLAVGTPVIVGTHTYNFSE